MLTANVGLPHRSIREAIALAIHLVVHIARVDGRRRVTEITAIRGYDAGTDRFQLEPRLLDRSPRPGRSRRMNTRSRLWSLITVVGVATACGGGTARPPRRHRPQSFLAGTWTGTLTIERDGEAHDDRSRRRWTFDVVPGTNLQTLSRNDPVPARVAPDQHDGHERDHAVEHAAGADQHAGRLRVASRMHAARLLSVGTVDATRLDADFSGVDCPTLEHSTFTGHVLLTKTGAERMPVDLIAPLRFLQVAYEPDDWVAVFLKSYATGRAAQRVGPIVMDRQSTIPGLVQSRERGRRQRVRLRQRRVTTPTLTQPGRHPRYSACVPRRRSTMHQTCCARSPIVRSAGAVVRAPFVAAIERISSGASRASP